MEHRIRLIEASDARRLTALLVDSRDYMAPWEPMHDESFFTEEGQREVIAGRLCSYESGDSVPLVILNDLQEVVGQLTLSSIVRGAFQSCDLGYWVERNSCNQGIATSAVGAALTVAFTRLGLHRVQAGTMLANAASQRVLRKNSFESYGMAPRYLKIAGVWEDHLLFQKLAE